MMEVGKPAGTLDEDSFLPVRHTGVIFGTLLGYFLQESKGEEIWAVLVP